MVLPLVWLADIPEAERDSLLHRLAKGLDTAEGLPATLPPWVQKVPVWQIAGQPQTPLPYAEQGRPNRMQPYPISMEYWREALHGRVDVAFDQNAVFWGHQGYLHVRVSQQQDDGLASTGMPGRPSISKHLIDPEFERRVAEDECEPSLAAEAQALLQWLKKHHPGAPRPGQSTLENNIRTDYAAWKARRAERPTK